MQRMRERYVEGGYTGLFDQQRGRRSIHRIAMETAERVLALYRDKYNDCNVRHFHEKLAEGRRPASATSGAGRRCRERAGDEEVVRTEVRRLRPVPQARRSSGVVPFFRYMIIPARGLSYDPCPARCSNRR